jgi:hypothetical protein
VYVYVCVSVLVDVGYGGAVWRRDESSAAIFGVSGRDGMRVNTFLLAYLCTFMHDELIFLSFRGSSLGRCR